MEAIVKAKKIGGSIGIIIPKQIVDKERIQEDDEIKVKIEKKDNLNLLWGKFKGVRKSTRQIMKEIDEVEIDG